MPKSSGQNRAASRLRAVLAGALVSALAALPHAVVAGEGGTTHVIAGAQATLADNAPTTPVQLRQADVSQLQREGVRADPDGCRTGQQPGREREKEQIRAKARNWNWGICHGDFYAGNINRKSDGNLSIYDFEFCGYAWRAYDVSPFLGNFGTGVREDAVVKRKRRLEYFLRGYKNAGGLSDSEIEAVYKIFVPFRRIFNMGYLYAAFHYVWGNKLRGDLITHDTKLLHEWIDYYW